MTKVRTKLSNCTGITRALANSLGFSDCDSILVSELEDARTAAFLSKGPHEFAFWYLKSEVFSKYVGLNDPLLRQVAMRKFYEAEKVCRETTPRLVGPLRSNALFPSDAIRTVDTARSIVKNILGRFDIEELPAACGWGPGATKELGRSRASLSNKWELATHVTALALPYVASYFRWSNLSRFTGDRFLVIDDSNRVTTVPKSYKTDRTIAIEPSWNSFLQKGLGRMMRRRLQRRGMLTALAQHENRCAAQLGSLIGTLSTIDLSMASDTVTVALCELLLPPDWLRVVLDLRSPEGEVVGPDGKPDHVVYEKVSSMGCGFTFELETLLFYALTQAACNKEDWNDVRAFGDDIICPSNRAEDVINTLEVCGFSVNTHKSFTSGPFRESCGGHYWGGEDVTPFYMKETPYLLSQVIEIGNKALVWSSHRRSDITFGLGNLLKGVYHAAARFVPRACRGPFGVSGTLWSEWDSATPRYNRHTQSFRVTSVTRKTRVFDESDRVGGLLCSLMYEVKDEDSDVTFSTRSTGLEQDKTKPRWIPSNTWSALPVDWL